MKTIEKVLAENIKHYRNLRGMKQGDLAEACGKSLSAIAQIETCVIWPTPDTIRAIADALGVKETDLLASPQESTPPRSNVAHVEGRILDFLRTLTTTELNIVFGIFELIDETRRALKGSTGKSKPWKVTSK